MPDTETMAETDLRRLALENLKADPFGGYSWALSSMEKVLNLSVEHYEYFPIEFAAKWVAEYFSKTAYDLPTTDSAAWDRGLRNYILLKLPSLIDNCTKCELSENRIPGRGACSHEGNADAKVFIQGEGPGAWESRTKIPFTGSLELRSSECATKCTNFWNCFAPNHTQYVRTPVYPCNYTPVKVETEELRRRMTSLQTPPWTVGEQLDKSLKKNRFTRKSFVKVLNVQQSLGMQSPDIRLRSDMFLTNAVKCRNQAMKPNGMYENKPPENSHMDACRPWTQIQLALVQPNAIVAMGSKSLYSLQSESKVAMVKNCGPDSEHTPKVSIKINGSEAWVMLHPSYWMHLKPEEHEAFKVKLDLDISNVYKSLATAIV